MSGRVNVEVFIGIPLVLYFDVARLTRHIREVVPRAVGEALISDGAEFSDLLVDEVMVHQTAGGHEGDR